jgi:hypothetical protein
LLPTSNNPTILLNWKPLEAPKLKTKKQQSQATKATFGMTKKHPSVPYPLENWSKNPTLTRSHMTQVKKMLSTFTPRMLEPLSLNAHPMDSMLSNPQLTALRTRTTIACQPKPLTRLPAKPTKEPMTAASRRINPIGVTKQPS